MNEAKRKKKAYRFGLMVEWLVLFFYLAQFYRIVAWRYRTKVGEIDIIVTRGKQLICIEVKARRRQAASLSELISHNQRQRIRAACRHFLATHPHYRDQQVRFDAVLVTLDQWPVRYKGAW